MLKFVPVIVTAVPILPDVGVKDVITGGIGADIVFLSTETVLLVLFATDISGLPSPSMSLRTTHKGAVPVVKSNFAANELAAIVPEVLVFLKTEIELLFWFATAKSGLPSPSMSPTVIFNGVVPVVKSTLAANDPVVIEPEVLVFLKRDNVLVE